MKAFKESHRKQFGRLASSFSLTEKLISLERDHDEHGQTGILTSGLPRSRLPDFRQWRWEFVSRYSGATVPDSHRVPQLFDQVDFQRANES